MVTGIDRVETEGRIVTIFLIEDEGKWMQTLTFSSKEVARNFLRAMELQIDKLEE